MTASLAVIFKDSPLWGYFVGISWPEDFGRFWLDQYFGEHEVQSAKVACSLAISCWLLAVSRL